MKPRPRTIPSLFWLAAVLLFIGLDCELRAAPSPTPGPHRLRNVSSRALIQSEPNVLIGGFIINGNTAKDVLIRALGPSLNVNGQALAGRLADPTLELYAQGNTVPIGTNDNWKTAQQNLIEATGIPPTKDLESAILATLNPGNYTAVTRGKNNGTGLGVLEVYELNSASTPKLANISARGVVQSGDNILIGGFIVGAGENSDSRIRTIIRALGPTLTTRGVSGALPNPTLELIDVQGNLLAFNDDWRDGALFEIEASGFAPPNDFESVLIATLSAGNYTAIVRGKNQSTGIGLVEIYDVPAPQQLGTSVE